MDWRDALLVQARSDFEMLSFLRLHNAPFCHQLHFLQMATEKLGKGFATAPGGGQPVKVHRAFVGFVRSVKSSVQLRQACRCGPGQIDAYIAALLPLARQIEDLRRPMQTTALTRSIRGKEAARSLRPPSTFSPAWNLMFAA